MSSRQIPESPEIRVLDEDTVNRIAAGEVVEGPRSVVKELLENSLDAGASRVDIDVEGAGHRLVRVVDDGCGMDEANALRCLERHATSKLRSSSDLHSTLTMGFRGEAIPSIAAVSRLVLVTRPARLEAATRLEVAGGRLESSSRVAAPVGTRIEVRHLFFNTPARRKFQRSPGAEMAAIREVVSDVLVARRDVAIRLRKGTETLLASPGGLDLGAAVERVLAAGEARELVPLEAATHPTLPFTLSGCVSTPALARPSSRGIRLFVNSRPFVSPALCRAISEGYRNLLPSRRWPVAFLFLECDPRAVDVNVHPQKKEVRFTGIEKLQEWLAAQVKEAVESRVTPRSVSHGRPLSEVAAPEPDRVTELPRQPLTEVEPEVGTGRSGSPAAGFERAAFGDVGPGGGPGRLPQGAPAVIPRPTRELAPGPRVNAAVARLFDPTPFRQPSGAVPDLVAVGAAAGEGGQPAPQPATGAVVRGRLFPGGVRFLGQVFRSFLVVADDEKVFYVDQHVAHERVLFEFFSAALAQGEPTVQNLLVPLDLGLAGDEVEVLEENLDLLGRHGFGVRVEDGRAWLRAVPVYPREIPAMEALKDTVRGFLDLFAKDAIEDEIESMADTMSCKAAIKAGMPMTPGEAVALLERLSECRYPLTCPHGRPILLTVDEAELRRRFLRSG